MSTYTVKFVPGLVRKPRYKSGVFLHIHEHQWVEHGSKTWPNGSTQPTWKCVQCGDIMAQDAEVPR